MYTPEPSSSSTEELDHLAELVERVSDRQDQLTESVTKLCDLFGNKLTQQLAQVVAIQQQEQAAIKAALAGIKGELSEIKDLLANG